MQKKKSKEQVMKFTIDEVVKIIPLGLEGRIIGIYITRNGHEYNVRYLANGNLTSAYFIDLELEEVDEKPEGLSWIFVKQKVKN